MLLSILVIVFSSSADVSDLKVCETTVRSLLCAADYPTHEFKPGAPYDFVTMMKKNQERPCKADKENLKDYFMDVYKTTPEPVQKLLCGLKVIFLEEGEDKFGAAISPYFDVNDVKNEVVGESTKTFDVKLSGLYMSVNATSRILNPETCSSASQRRLNGYFSTDLEASLPLLPLYTYENDSLKCDFYGTLIHEAGHVFDFANGDISNTEAWLSIGWIKTPIHLPDGTVTNSYQPQFDEAFLAMTTQALVSTQIVPLFAELNKSPFPTFYSIYHPTEDFAEEFALHFGAHNYVLATTDGSIVFNPLENSKTVPSRIAKVAKVATSLADPNVKYVYEPRYETMTMPLVIPGEPLARDRFKAHILGSRGHKPHSVPGL